MNNRQILAALLATFVVLNIFLLQIFLDGSIYAPTRVHTFDLSVKLKEKGIKINLDNDLLEEVPNMFYLSSSVQGESLEEQLQKIKEGTRIYDAAKRRLTVTLTKPLTLDLLDNQLSKSDEEKIQALLLDEQMFYKGNQYTYLYMNKGKREIYYVQKQGDYLIDDEVARLTFHLVDNEIVSWSQEYMPEFIREDATKPIASKQSVLALLYSISSIPESSIIEDMQLIYRRMIHVENTLVYSPIWLVKVITKEKAQLMLSVDAVTNTLLPDISDKQESN